MDDLFHRGDGRCVLLSRGAGTSPGSSNEVLRLSAYTCVVSVSPLPYPARLVVEVRASTTVETDRSLPVTPKLSTAGPRGQTLLGAGPLHRLGNSPWRYQTWRMNKAIVMRLSTNSHAWPRLLDLWTHAKQRLPPCPK